MSEELGVIGHRDRGCPTCGQRVAVQTAEEGTASYVPVAEREAARYAEALRVIRDGTALLGDHYAVALGHREVHRIATEALSSKGATDST